MNSTSLQIIRQKLSEIAPRILEFSLNEGAKENDFSELESLTGKSLPQDFKDLYKTYNGMNTEENFGSLFYGMNFASLEEIVADHEFRISQAEENERMPLKKSDPQIDPSNLFNTGWIQFASDGSRCGLYLDLSPSENGTYGQVIFIDGTYDVGIFVAASVSTLVDQFATDLQNNLYSLEPDALEDGQHYLETADEIDLVNWFQMEKWKPFLEN